MRNIAITATLALSLAIGTGCGKEDDPAVRPDNNNAADMTPDATADMQETDTATPDMSQPDMPAPDMSQPDMDVPDLDPADMPDPDMGPPSGSGDINGVMEVGQGASTPLDATPSPGGEAIYFTAVRQDGIGALYQTSPGVAPVEVASGFDAPISVVVSMDGTRAFVADAGGDDEATNPNGGVIYSVNLFGGAFSALDDATGYQVRGLDLTMVGGAETLTFTGISPNNGEPGVFQMPSGGGAVTTVASGAPLADPSGVAAAADGTVYVADALLDGSSGIVTVSGGAPTVALPRVRVGYPAGVALSRDGSHLLVSGLDPAMLSAVVYRIELLTGTVSMVSMGIDQNTESAGVHRAHNVDQYAWANADSPGGVYYIGTSQDPL